MDLITITLSNIVEMTVYGYWCLLKVPHYSYTKIYGSESGEISKVIIEMDGDEFYQAVTEIRNKKPYFNEQEIHALGSTVLMSTDALYEKHIKYAVEKGYLKALSNHKIIYFVRIEKPKDCIPHLWHKRFLKQTR